MDDDPLDFDTTEYKPPTDVADILAQFRNNAVYSEADTTQIGGAIERTQGSVRISERSIGEQTTRQPGVLLISATGNEWELAGTLILHYISMYGQPNELYADREHDHGGQAVEVDDITAGWADPDHESGLEAFHQGREAYAESDEIDISTLEELTRRAGDTFIAEN
ncbi:hypothetical protein RYH80_18465 [Halobaculum sp. MBLA0147]|uniref:hypothetical protein n=1 Tax=Halobaculum sp. MBLA0147 TaxID=3079934 RepID=UPI0035265A49